MFLLKPMYKKKEKPGRSSNTVTFLPRKVCPGAGKQLLETNIDVWHTVWLWVAGGPLRCGHESGLTQLQAWTELRRVHQQWKPNFPSSHPMQRDLPSVKVHVWSQLLGNMGLSSQEIPRCPSQVFSVPVPVQWQPTRLLLSTADNRPLSVPRKSRSKVRVRRLHGWPPAVTR